MSADVQVISRGMNGDLLLRGTFRVYHRELVDGEIRLTCHEIGGANRILSVSFPAEAIEEVPPPAGDESIRALAAAAEDVVLQRLRL